MTATITAPLDLDAIEARANAATPGPWHPCAHARTDVPALVAGIRQRNAAVAELLDKYLGAEAVIEAALDALRDPLTLDAARLARHGLVQHYNAIRKEAARIRAREAEARS